MKDWRGVEITKGATIVYATRQSSWMGMVEAVVDEVTEDTVKATVIRRQGGGEKTKVTLGNNYATVVSLPESTAVTLEDDIAEKRKRHAQHLAEQAAREAACGDNHAWKNLYGYRQCEACRKYEYGDYYADEYRRRW